MKALTWDGTKAKVVRDRTRPRPRPDYLVVRVVAVALNPTGCKAISQGRAAKDGLLGCDFAGIVGEIGPQVVKQWKKGNRIFSCAHGANFNESEDGAFAEAIAVKGDTTMAIPDHVSFEEAATMGVSALTCGQGLFQKMGLNIPSSPIEDKEFLLIYGGSTSSGTLANQYARLAGYTVLVTCSSGNADLCKSLGAEAAFDYHNQDCGQQIHQYTNGQLRLVWDTIGSELGVQICIDALASGTGARYGTILFNTIPRKDVAYDNSYLVTIIGEAFDKFGSHMEARPEAFAFAKRFANLTEILLGQGKLRPHPVKLGNGALQGVVSEGVNLMNEGKVSGCKPLYRLADTI